MKNYFKYQNADLNIFLNFRFRTIREKSVRFYMGFNEIEILFFDFIAGKIYDMNGFFIGSYTEDENFYIRIIYQKNKFSYFYNDLLIRSNVEIKNFGLNNIGVRHIDGDIKFNLEVNYQIKNLVKSNFKKALFITSDRLIEDLFLVNYILESNIVSGVDFLFLTDINQDNINKIKQKYSIVIVSSKLNASKYNSNLSQLTNIKNKMIFLDQRTFAKSLGIKNEDISIITDSYYKFYATERNNLPKKYSKFYDFIINNIEEEQNYQYKIFNETNFSTPEFFKINKQRKSGFETLFQYYQQGTETFPLLDFFEKNSISYNGINIKNKEDRIIINFPIVPKRPDFYMEDNLMKLIINCIYYLINSDFI